MTLDKIDSFRGDYRFLSNFYPAIILYKRDSYATVEHAYQAAKTTDAITKQYIMDAATPAQAKARARSLRYNLTPDFHKNKLELMKTLVTCKFVQHVELMRQLIATGTRILEEGNTWGDHYWGVCDGRGENHLGYILMDIRDNHIIVNNKVRKAFSGVEAKVDRRDD